MADTQSMESRLLQAMQHVWGYKAFLPLQREAMGCVMTDRDSVVVLPTGGGKSLCFQVPAVCKEGLAVVVSPLISLMKDQVDALRACGVAASAMNSAMSLEERRETGRQIRSGELKLLYVAPERLVLPRTLEFLSSVRVSLVAVDEAHCISQWGHDFRPEYRGLRVLKEALPGVGVHAYTATASHQVQRDIAQQLGLVDPSMLVGSFDRPNLTFRAVRTANRLSQIRRLIDVHRGESGIVYCISRREVDETSAHLAELGYRALPYHAGLSDATRHENQEAFLEERADIVVATVAFGMGIDKSNVRFVIHAGMPKSLENYMQESGRAGRDGLEADCVLLYSDRDPMLWRRMIEEGEPSALAGAQQSLDAMWNFCTSVRCRHQALVEYFGQTLDKENCGACDVCLGDVDLVADALIIAQKIVSCVARVEQRYGADYTAKVLIGSEEQRIIAAGHARLSTYGLLAEHSVRAVRGWIEQLVGQKFLRKAGEYNVLQITDLGRELLRGKAQPQLSQPAPDREGRARSVRLDPLDAWEGVDRGLFAGLRTLRARLAAERGVPPYVVFADVALRDMARRRPSTSQAFLEIKGVGEKKQADYGEAFLQAIADYCGEHQIEMDIRPATPTPTKVAAQRRPDATARPNRSSCEAFAHFRRGASIAETSLAVGRARSTVAGYLSQFLVEEHRLDPSPWVDPATARQIEEAADEVGGEKLRPIFEFLDGKVDYDAIRIVLACRANRIAT